MGRAEPDPVTAHARAVAAGEVVVNRLHQRACERHLDDLVSGSARGLSLRSGGRPPRDRLLHLPPPLQWAVHEAD
jgi:hypothetical protein